MERLLAIGGGLLTVVASIASMIVFWGTSAGVVKEHCVDPETTETGSIDVDSHWTYIIWPPLTLANTDPIGDCVRNSPLHEGLNEVGILSDLGSPEEQVIDHLREQTSAPSSTDEGTDDGTDAGTDEAQYNNDLAGIINEAAQESDDFEQTGDVEAAADFQIGLYDRIIPELEALTPPTSMEDLHDEVLLSYHRDRDLSIELLDAFRSGDASAVQALVAESESVQSDLFQTLDEIRERALGD